MPLQPAREALIARLGSVVNIGSKCAVIGQGGISAYAAAQRGAECVGLGTGAGFCAGWRAREQGDTREVMMPLCGGWICPRPAPEAAWLSISNTIFPVVYAQTTFQEVFEAFFCSSRRVGNPRTEDQGPSVTAAVPGRPRVSGFDGRFFGSKNGGWGVTLSIRALRVSLFRFKLLTCLTLSLSFSPSSHALR